MFFFELAVETVILNGQEPAQDTFMYPKLLGDISKTKGVRPRMAPLSTAEGAMLELQECENPGIEKTPQESLCYGHTGFHGLERFVEDTDKWFGMVREAGYKT